VGWKTLINKPTTCNCIYACCRRKLRSLLTVSMYVCWKQAGSDLTQAKLRLCSLALRGNWPKCSLMMFQCCHLNSGSSILRGSLVLLLIVNCQCLHMLQQSVMAATISCGNCGHSRDTDEAIKTLMHAFISSRLDYCNVLYCRIAEGLLSRLQSVQNAAARLVTRLGRREHITPVLRQLHWLPVRQCVMFKLAIWSIGSQNMQLSIIVFVY